MSSASNRLYCGDVGSPLEALELHALALEQEAREQRQLTDEWNSDIPKGEKPWDYSLVERLELEAKQTRKLITQYHERMSKIQQELFREWSESEDQQIQGIGQILISEDYQALAV